MKNFIFYNPVIICFGAGQISSVGNAIKSSYDFKENDKILLTYGQGSIKKNGVYNSVIQNLKNFKIKIVEFAGIEPNPDYNTLMQAVALIRKENIKFILAIGGGSVIDGTKFISAAVHFSEDPWNILFSNKKTEIKNAIPFGCILTLPGTGSEMNSAAVISRRTTSDKLSFVDASVFPKFSILDPTTTFSLPINQTCNGIVDAFVHVIEQYLIGNSGDTPIQDRWAEGILLTLIESAYKILETPNDYETRANIMWACTMALNGIISVGIQTDWSTHRIGHQLTAQCGLDHAQTLAIIMPRIMRIRKEFKKQKLIQYANRVWNIENGTNEEKITICINKTENFFKILLGKTKLSEYKISKNCIQSICEQLKKTNMINLGEDKKINEKMIKQILEESF